MSIELKRTSLSLPIETNTKRRVRLAAGTREMLSII
jgi:hypothetical protein